MDKKTLEELNKMVGLTSIKEEIIILVLHLMLISNSPTKLISFLLVRTKYFFNIRPLIIL